MEFDPHGKGEHIAVRQADGSILWVPFVRDTTPETVNRLSPFNAMHGLFNPPARLSAQFEEAKRRIAEELQRGGGIQWYLDPDEATRRLYHVKHASLLKFEHRLTDEDRAFLKINKIDPS